MQSQIEQEKSHLDFGIYTFSHILSFHNPPFVAALFVSVDKREIITGDWLLQLGSDDNGIRSHKYTKVSSIMDYITHNGLELGDWD